jgi:hypothetical protein
MLAAFSDLFAWYQIPLVMIFLPVWIFGVGTMLFIGGRYIAKSPKATYGWSILTHILSGLGGFLAMGIVIFLGAMLSEVVDSPGPVIISVALSLVASLFVVWWIIQAMFKVSFGKAVLAWLPMFGLQFVLTGPLMVSILLPSVNRARELAKRAVCKTRLKGLGTALELYCQCEEAYPSDLKDLVEENYCSSKQFICPSAGNSKEISYFFLSPKKTDAGPTFVMCDYKGNHENLRNVLLKSGVVKEFSEEAFQAELSQPYNARFAAAIKKAEGP